MASFWDIKALPTMFNNMYENFSLIGDFKMKKLNSTVQDVFLNVLSTLAPIK